VALISHARHALDAAEQGIAALAGELERSRRLRAEAQGLSARAQELLLGAPRPLRT